MRGKRLLVLTLLVAAELTVLFSIAFVSSGINSPVGWGWLGGYEAVLEEFVPLQSIDKVFIDNNCGKVTVRAVNNQSDYGVRVVRHGYGFNKEQATELLAKIKVNVDQTPTGTHIVVEHPDLIVNRTPHANLEVLVPAQAAVEVKANLGSVTVDGLQTATDINARMGKVNVINVQGNISVDAGMGKVILRDVFITDRLYVLASMGAVEFKGQLGKENDITASMGSINLKLNPDQPALQLHANCSMGNIKNSFTFTGNIDKQSAHGKLGVGSVQGQLTLKANMGSIKIY